MPFLFEPFELPYERFPVDAELLRGFEEPNRWNPGRVAFDVPAEFDVEFGRSLKPLPRAPVADPFEARGLLAERFDSPRDAPAFAPFSVPPNRPDSFPAVFSPAVTGEK